MRCPMNQSWYPMAAIKAAGLLGPELRAGRPQPRRNPFVDTGLPDL